MIGIIGIDHLHGSPGWRRFIAEQRNRLPEIPGNGVKHPLGLSWKGLLSPSASN
jgi:hypothetical protein